MAFFFTNTPEPEQQLQAMVIDRFKVEAGKINVTDFDNNRGAMVRTVYGIVRDEAERLYRQSRRRGAGRNPCSLRPRRRHAPL